MQINIYCDDPKIKRGINLKFMPLSDYRPDLTEDWIE